jgi:Amt family ammonium transporter
LGQQDWKVFYCKLNPRFQATPRWSLRYSCRTCRLSSQPRSYPASVWQAEFAGHRRVHHVSHRGFIIPLAGGWAWGGGWLSTLGPDAQLGHGDRSGGIAAAFVAAGFVTLAALMALRLKRSADAGPTEPAAVVGPARSIFGALLFVIGWLLWIATNPIVKAIPSIDLSFAIANILVGTAAATIVALLLGWFFSGAPSVPLVAHGVIGGLIVSTPLAPFSPTWAVLVTGAIGGLLIRSGPSRLNAGCVTTTVAAR